MCAARISQPGCPMRGPARATAEPVSVRQLHLKPNFATIPPMDADFSVALEGNRLSIGGGRFATEGSAGQGDGHRGEPARSARQRFVRCAALAARTVEGSEVAGHRQRQHPGDRQVLAFGNLQLLVDRTRLRQRIVDAGGGRAGWGRGSYIGRGGASGARGLTEAGGLGARRHIHRGSHPR